MERTSRIVALNASHRGDRGVTRASLSRISRGATAGAECEILTLAKFKIQRCLSCYQCQVGPRHLVCVYNDKDDVRMIFDQIAGADLLIFASQIISMVRTFGQEPTENENAEGAIVNTNPFLGFLETLLLFIEFRVIFRTEDKDKQIVMEDGLRFRIFRHVEIRDEKAFPASAVFVVRFRPKNMTVQENIRFSLLPMMIFMGFHGFREKVWCVNDETGLCQGVYAWQTREDAENYSRSIAMRFMTNRSYPESVSFRVLDQDHERYWLFDRAAIRQSK